MVCLSRRDPYRRARGRRHDRHRYHLRSGKGSDALQLPSRPVRYSPPFRRPTMSASRNFLPEGCPVHSPWGEVQPATRFADGIYSVSTAGHGGFKVSDEFNKLIPEPFRADGGWYEEDCD